MKKLFVFSMLAFSMFFLACEEDVIPIPLPPPAQAVTNEPAPSAEGKSEPQQVLVEKPSEPAKPAKAQKEAPAKVVKEPPPPKDPPRTPAFYSGDAEQLKTGRYIIQVGIYPTEASAKKIIKKLSDEGIKAYNAKVDNPDPEKGMIGTYNRVRIGFFNVKPAAEAFAKSKLEPLGYRWWVDRGRNDNIGKYSESETSEPFVAKKATEQTSKQMTEQERKDAERAAAIAAAKEEYKAIAKAANATVNAAPVLPPPKIPAKANPPPPVIKPVAKETDSHGRVKMKSQRQQ